MDFWHQVGDAIALIWWKKCHVILVEVGDTTGVGPWLHCEIVLNPITDAVRKGSLIHLNATFSNCNMFVGLTCCGPFPWEVSEIGTERWVISGVSSQWRDQGSSWGGHLGYRFPLRLPLPCFCF